MSPVFVPEVKISRPIFPTTETMIYHQPHKYYMPHLVVRKPNALAFSVSFDADFHVGRHAANDLVFDDAQVSRQHATISKASGRWEVRDLESRYGTRVNGEVITTHVLRNHDRIELGNATLEFQEGDEQPIVHHEVVAAGPPSRDVGTDKRLHLLFDVSRAIGAMGDMDRMLGEMLDAIIDVFDCERAAVGLGDAERGIIRRIARVRSTSSSTTDFVLSRAIIKATLTRREAVIVRDAQREPALATLRREHILSAMAVPLGLSIRPIGLLYVDDRQAAERFGPDDLAFLTALGHLVCAALESAERYQRATDLAEALSASNSDEIIGQSPVMKALRTRIAKVAGAVHANVLVRGESGSGKELVAHALHRASPRIDRPFVTLNCAAIPETILESELFGHERGFYRSDHQEARQIRTCGRRHIVS